MAGVAGAAGDGAGAASGGTRLELASTGRDACAPAALTAPAGEITIVFTNPHGRAQSFGVAGVGAGAPDDVRDGESSTLRATLAAGTYTFWCGDDADDPDAMRGTLAVTGTAGGPTPQPPAAAPPSEVRVTVSEYAFSPTALEAAAGTVTVTVTNAGSDLHTWTAPGLATVTVAPGETRSVSFSAGPGTYSFLCAVGSHADKGMRGTLTVVGTPGAPPAPPPPAPPSGPPPAAPAPAPPPAGPLTLAMDEFSFSPPTLSAAAGTVSLRLENRGQLPHTFTIDGLVDLEVPAGETRSATFTVAPGSYRFYCSVAGHQAAGMAGMLVVVAAGGAVAPPAPPLAPPPSAPQHAGSGEGGAPAASHVHVHPRARLPRGCRPRPAVVLRGTLVSIMSARLTLRVTRANARGRRYVGRRTSVTLHARTAFVSVGQLRVATLERGDRVTVAAGRCRARRGALIAASVTVTGRPPATQPDGTVLALRADPRGLPRFDRTSLAAPAGRVTLRLVNPSPVPHSIAIQGRASGRTVGSNGVSTVTAVLEPGTYAFVCGVAGHAQAGMRGTLVVR
ncbi:MAG: cupredoxin domain-containing protein [Thermoleophilia bacterium]|nr:cupredoxin domain-containing protein [Thermoleophilia bacterium]